MCPFLSDSVPRDPLVRVECVAVLRGARARWAALVGLVLVTHWRCSEHAEAWAPWPQLARDPAAWVARSWRVLPAGFAMTTGVALCSSTPLL